MARSTDWTWEAPGSLPPLAALFVTFRLYVGIRRSLTVTLDTV
jgi:hypothetical protein